MKKRTKGVLAAALAAAGVFLLAGLDARLLVRAYTVESGRLTGPVRLAVLTDLHACAYGEGQRELLDAVAEQSPDLVLLCGDIVDDEPRMPEARALDTVEALAAVWPTYYVTGNHEAGASEYDALKTGLIKLGVTVLENEKTEVERDGEKITLIGVKDPSFSSDYLFHDEEAIMESQLKALVDKDDGFTLLLSHRPELFEVYVTCNADLVLSGHAHGGQFRLPFIGGLAAPNQGLFPKYDAGLFSEGKTKMIVSRGIGNSIFPFRVNNRPEIILIELQTDGA